jgi:hypothetical protein
MMANSTKLSSEEQLEELLSKPSAETIELFSRIDGDILILGVGGKIGPSLAYMAKCACYMAGIKKRVIGVSLFDAANNFKGCIAGINEVLFRQGLLEGVWTLNQDEKLSPGQKEEIDRV